MEAISAILLACSDVVPWGSALAVPSNSDAVARFDTFELDLRSGELRQNSASVKLQPQPAKVLVLLVNRAGQVITREELAAEVWGSETFVDFEHGLNFAIRQIRSALGDDADEPRFLETLPKRGYRFVAAVEIVPRKPSTPSARDSSGTALQERSASGEPIASAASPPSATLLSSGRRVHPRIWWAAGVAALVFVGALFAEHYWPRTHAGSRIMLAVLPVQNLTGDASQEFLSDGLTEELISQLGGFNPQQLGVIARTSSMSYKGSNKTITQIANELGVDYVVETSVRGSPEHMRFTAQLVRSQDQSHVWARNFDRSVHDLVAMQDEVGRSIAKEIQLRLTPRAAAEMERRLGVQPDSYQDYLQGRYYWNQRTREGMETGLNYFREAVKKDPSNARALTGIADSYNTLLFYGYSNDVAAMMKAQQAAEQALKLDDSLAEAHAALGYVYFMWTWQWPEAEREFRRAIELDQNYVSAHHWFALYLVAMGRAEQADQEIRAAETLDPVSPIVRTARAYVHYFNRDYDKSIQECAAVLQANPNFVVAHAVLGMAYEGKGATASAVTEFTRALDLSNQNLTYKTYLARAYARGGNQSGAAEILADLDDRAKQGVFVGQYNKALVYDALGDRNKAVESLAHAREQNDANMIWLRVDPRWDSLRDDPRFAERFRSLGTRR